jgi:hypothetical protein
MFFKISKRVFARDFLNDFSPLFFRLLFSLLPSVFLGGILSCTPKIGETPPSVQTQGLTATACLDQAAVGLQNFVKAKATEGDIVQSFDCIQTAFEKFDKYVRGAQRDRYKIAELCEFFENYFLAKDSRGKTKKISPELQVELMKIKQIFVGGTREDITREELKKTLTFISQIKGMALKLNSFMSVVILDWNPDRPLAKTAQLDHFEEANKMLQSVIGDFANLIQANSESTYVIGDFAALFGRLSEFYGEVWPFVATLERTMPLVSKIKVALIGGDGPLVIPSEWGRFLNLAARSYVQYLRYYYFIENNHQATQEAKLDTMARIAEDSLSMLQDLVGRKVIQEITQGEFQGILLSASEVFDSIKVSEAFVDHLMKVKPVLFGGSSAAWTPTDFGLAGSKVYRIKDLIQRLIPFKTIYTKKWNFQRIDTGVVSDGSEERGQISFAAAEEALLRAANDLSSLLEAAYSYEDLKNLVLEFEVLYPSTASSTSEDWPMDRRGRVQEPSPKPSAEPSPQPSAEPSQSLSLGGILQKYQGLFLKIKELIYDLRLPNGSPSPEIRKEDWKSFLNYGSRAFSISLFAHYFLNPFELDSSAGVKSTSRLIESALSIIPDVLTQRRNRANPGISTAEFSQIFLELRKLEILPAKIQVETMKGVMKALIENFLVSPVDRIRPVQGVTIPRSSFDIISFEHLRAEFRTWIQPEIFLAEEFEKVSSRTLSQSQLKALIELKSLDREISSEFKEGLNELRVALNTPMPITTDISGRMLITNHQTPFFNRKSAFYSNLSRTVSRLLIRSYSQDLEGLNSSIGSDKCKTADRCERLNKCEGIRAFEDLRAPFIDLNLLDVGSSFLDSRFLEANLFVARASGDNDVNFLELGDLTQMILSGLFNDAKLKIHLRRDCRTSINAGTKKEEVGFKCLRESYYGQAIRSEMTGVPGYLAEMKSIDGGIWREGFVNLVKATGWIPKGLSDIDQELVDINTLSLFPHIVQYLEMVFSKYDVNGDEVISTDELMSAYPTYRALMYDLAKDRFVPLVFTENDLPALFAYLVKHGKEPSFGIISGGKWLAWKAMGQQNWKVNAGRTQIAKILGYISDKVSGSTKPPPPVCPQRK